MVGKTNYYQINQLIFRSTQQRVLPYIIIIKMQTLILLSALIFTDGQATNNLASGTTPTMSQSDQSTAINGVDGVTTYCDYYHYYYYNVCKNANTLQNRVVNNPAEGAGGWYRVDLGADWYVNSVLITVPEQQYYIYWSSLLVSISETGADGTTIGTIECNTLTEYMSQWIDCIESGPGQYVWLSGATYIRFSEIMIFTGWYVQDNYYLLTASSLISISTEALAFATSFATTSNPSINCFVTGAEDYPNLLIEMKAKTTFSSVIWITALDLAYLDVSYSSDLYCSDLQVAVYDENDIIVGTCPDIVDAIYDPESYCNGIKGFKIKITRNCLACSMGACSIGIISNNCLCSTNSFAAADMQDEFYVAEIAELDDDVVLEVKLGHSEVVTTYIQTLTDTSSLICGSADGTSYCDVRQIAMWSNDLSAYHDMATSTYLTYDSATDQLTIQLTDAETFGEWSFTLRAYLDLYAAAGYFPQEKTFTIQFPLPFTEITNRDGSELKVLDYQIGNQVVVEYELTTVTDSTVTVDYSIVYTLVAEGSGNIVYTLEAFNSCGSTACVYLQSNTDGSALSLTLLVTKMQIDLVLTLTALCVYDGVTSLESVSVTFTVNLIACEINTLTADSPNLTYFYKLGTDPAILAVSAYTQVPDCGYAVTEFASEFQLPLANDYLTDEAVSALPSGFVIWVEANEVLPNTFQQWKLTANFEDGSTNKESLITVWFLAGDINYAPSLESDPNSSDIIPCVDSKAAKSWVFEFFKASDPNNDEIGFGLSCPTLSVDLFKQEVDSQNILTLKLNSEPMFLPTVGVHDCTLNVYDPDGAQNSYQASFEVDCVYDLNSDSDEFSNEGKIVPIPSVRGISNKGLITILWNVDMKPYENLADLTTYQDSAKPISISLLPGSEYSYADKLDLSSYWVTEWNNRELKIQLNVTNPLFVSGNPILDNLVIIFKGSKYFRSKDSASMELEYEIDEKMPPQALADQLSIDVSGATTAGMALLGASLVLQVFLSSLLNQMLGLIDNLAVVAHMFLISVSFPVNVSEFFSTIFPLITFDFLQINFLNEILFKFSERDNESLSYSFSAVGYTQTLLIPTLGDKFYMVLFSPLIVLLLGGMRELMKSCKCKWLHKYFDSQYTGLLWNGVIGFFYANYLVMAIAVLMQFYDPKFGPDNHWTEKMNSYVNVLYAAILFAFPITVTLLYSMKLERVDPYPDFDPKMPIEEINMIYGCSDFNFIRKFIYTESRHKHFTDTYGHLIDGVRIKELGKTVSIIIPFMHMVRKLIAALAIIFFIERPYFAIIVFNYTTMISLMMELYYWPLEDYWGQVQVITNEITIQLIVYHLFCLTDFTEIEVRQITVGNSAVMVIFSNVMVNILFYVVPLLFGLCKKCKYRRVRWVKKWKRRLGMQVNQTCDKEPSASVDQTPVEYLQAPVEPMLDVTSKEQLQETIYPAPQKKKVIIADGLDMQLHDLMEMEMEQEMEEVIADDNDKVINEIVRELDDVSQLSEVPEENDDVQLDNPSARSYEQAMAELEVTELEITELVSEQDVTAAEIVDVEELQQQLEEPKEEVKAQEENKVESVPPKKTQPIQEASKEDFWSALK